MSAPDDQNIWANYAKGVQKLNEKGPPEKEEIRPLKPVIEVEVKEELAPILSTPQTPAPQPLDTRVERNMSLGDVMVEARMDLHGKTEQEAYDAYKNFIEKQSALGRRMLLVITGKSGILRVNLPRWSQTEVFSPYVAAVRTAALHHGGEGAYYVLLNKRTR